MASDEWSRIEQAIRAGLGHLRQRYLRSTRGRPEERPPPEPGPERPLRNLPVEVQLYIMALLSPRDLCQLGSVNRYWNTMVRDPLLWRYFLLRDLPHWKSVDYISLPDAALLSKPLTDTTEQDYMAAYLRSCPEGRKHWKASHPVYSSVTSFLYSLVSQSEPRFAMFGPGLEQLDTSLVTKMMNSPRLLPVAGLPQRQIDGIGSGISFYFNKEHKFNILTLYSTTWKERECARREENTPINKLFVQQEVDDVGDGESDLQQGTTYSIIPQVQQVCRVVDGFIYVANAEARREHNRREEILQIQAMINPALGPPGRPLLVLCCVSQPDIHRIPCVYVSHQLQLSLLAVPWLAQDSDAETLVGFLEGIEWILRELGRL
ncbi:F-box only protein 4 [Pristis pectinata]|uniref:F-box only protein 4 n=1 Tax=Pristis pectinata TaxID=685728 RepID=UPI00223CC0E4|nr:F-box only protein 4 [Pristis pectinata]